ncbi:MAG: protein kinase domain-containing protein [Thermoanaerobaculia bacterium]
MLPAGKRLGPYEILAPIGAGGMGDVYRARDTRLGRELAIKVLPPEFVASPERRRRFENEARAASALNHPNVLHVYDIGQEDSTYYIAMELVEGRTLREAMAAGAMTTKKLLDVAVPVADALAKTHAAGIVHRDLKPENIMISRDGFVKVLDFGLAKLAEDSLSDSDETATQRQHITESGALLGTVAYMSPEQAAGRTVDFRSDQFSFGTILYELVTGRRPFSKPSQPQTLAAIIESEPEPIESIHPEVPRGLRRIIERCLSKQPEDRYGATADLARDLKDLRDDGLETVPDRARASSSSRAPARKREARNIAIAASLAIIAASAIAWLVVRGRSPDRPVHFDRLTFRRGIVWNARFAPDRQTIVYGAAWSGKPFEVFSSRIGEPESRPLGIEGADLMSVSTSGDLALSLGSQFFQSFQTRGTLARAPLGGGVPRPLLDFVQWADWSPDGHDLAVVREVGGRARLEYPIGKILYQSGGWLGNPRVSPDGQSVAFIDHQVDHDPSGLVVLVDRNGRSTILAKGFADVEGLAWPPSGREVWFTASRRGVPDSLMAVTLDGQERAVMEFPAQVRLQDIDATGRVLLLRESVTFSMSARQPGASTDRDLSFFDISVPRDISEDGKTILMLAESEGVKSFSVYLRPTDGSPAVWLGDGIPTDLSPDGTWAMSFVTFPAPAQLWRLPTGTGQPVPLTADGIIHSWGNIFPDGQRILFVGNEPGHGRRLYVQPVSGGAPQPISPEGVDFSWHAISPDGKQAAAYGPDHTITLYPVTPGAPFRTPLSPIEEPIGWTADGQSLYVFRRGEIPARIYRANVRTGAKTLWRELVPPDSTGLESMLRIQITPDEQAYAYSSVVRLSTLYVATGLK